MAKLSPPQGTRDFSAEVIYKRNFIFDTIKNTFKNFGFTPLETPAMEQLETLMGKYGEEGDKLIFKILNNGLNDEKNIDKSKAGFEQVLQGKNDVRLTERALKYDLTIPFARYVAANHQQLPMPFKRYQIQPVWRADRPQKGRYREFYQCDADIAGSNSLWNEVECVMLYFSVFTKLGIKNFEVRLNHRLLLTALAEECGGADRMLDISIAIDKLDKIGWDGVVKILNDKGISNIELIEKVINLKGNFTEKIKQLKEIFSANENALKALSDFEFIIAQTQSLNQNNQLVLDTSLARGLNYYTGCIFEVKVNDVQIGSVGGGGRYNELTASFGVPNIPGVGISFGVDRIYDVMEELGLFSAHVQNATQVLFFNLGEKEATKSYELIQKLREIDIAAELYPEANKMDKQFKYAEKKGTSYVVIIGATELAEKKINIKNINTKQQITINENELITFFNKIALI